jgi:hypothetical protein
MLETTDTLDLIPLELDLDCALDELRQAAAGLESAVRTTTEVRALVLRVQNRVLWGKGDVDENIRDLTHAKSRLKELETDTQEARRRLEAYLEAWSRKAAEWPSQEEQLGGIA